MISALTLLQKQLPESCPECGTTGLIRDMDAGEVVCPGCGLVVENIISRRPEWSIFEPEHMQTVPRATPLLIPALTSADFTYLTRLWTHRDPEVQATMHRIRRQQTKTGDKDGRNYFHAKNMLFKLGDRAHMPLALLNQAAEVYRRAYKLGLVRGRSIGVVIAASIYATYRLQGVPRTLKEMAKAMNIEVKDLSRTYNLLVRELHLSPRNPKAENHVSKLADTLHLAPEEMKAALDLLREARRVKLTVGKDPRGLAAAAIYIAQLSRSRDRITQAKIAEASGVTEVTIRNRYKGLKEVAATLHSFHGFIPVSTISPFTGFSER